MLENTLFSVRRGRDRQLGLAAELHLHRLGREKEGWWGGVPEGAATSASRTPPPGSALPGGKSPPSSFQKKDDFVAGEGVNSKKGLLASGR